MNNFTMDKDIIRVEIEGYIESVVRNIDDKLYFDAHFIINELIRTPEISITYCKFCACHETMASAHSELSKIIKSFRSMVRDTGDDSFSFTIHDKADKCRLYQRI